MLEEWEHHLDHGVARSRVERVTPHRPVVRAPGRRTPRSSGPRLALLAPSAEHDRLAHSRYFCWWSCLQQPDMLAARYQRPANLTLERTRFAFRSP